MAERLWTGQPEPPAAAADHPRDEDPPKPAASGSQVAPQRPVGTAIAVGLAVFFPLFALVWGGVRIGRGDVAFGVSVIALGVVELLVLALLV